MIDLENINQTYYFIWQESKKENKKVTLGNVQILSVTLS